jgi:hypothetical protein
MRLFLTDRLLRTSVAVCVSVYVLTGVAPAASGRSSHESTQWVVHASVAYTNVGQAVPPLHQVLPNGGAKVIPGYMLVPLDEPMVVTVDVTPPSALVDSNGHPTEAYVVVIEIHDRNLTYTVPCGEPRATTCSVSLAPPTSSGVSSASRTLRVLVKNGFKKSLASSDQPLTIVYSTTPGSLGTTWDQMTAYRNRSNVLTGLKWTLVVAGTFTGGCALVAAKGVQLAWGFATLGLGVGATVADSKASSNGTLGNDPVDKNYTELATPVSPPPLLLPSATGMKGAINVALNALATNTSQVTGLTSALVTSLDRAAGAQQAHQSAWVTRQLVAASGFARSAAALIQEEPGLWAQLQQAVSATGIHFDVSAAASQQTEHQVLSHGLAAYFRQVLGSGGMDRRSLDHLVGDLHAAPALPGPITFPGVLTEPALSAASAEEAAALEQFAATAAQGVVTPPDTPVVASAEPAALPRAEMASAQSPSTGAQAAPDTNCPQLQTSDHVWSGWWNDSFGGISFRYVSTQEGIGALAQYGAQKLGCAADADYYRGGYDDGPNETGKAIGCTAGGPDRLIGRYVADTGQSPGDFDLQYEGGTPPTWTGTYTPDGGSAHAWKGTFRTHFSGDGCCSATAPPA